MIKRINIEFIPHSNQKYSTCGDYWKETDNIEIRISKTQDWRHSFLVLLHEISEIGLTLSNDISWEEIDQFDMVGEGKDSPDPGCLPSAPYHNEHMLSIALEKMYAKFLGINWEDYNTALDELEYPEK